MIYPSKSEFMKLARKGNLVPVYKEISADFETPLSSFIKINDGKFSYLLESVEGGERLGRFSFLGSRPSLVFQSKGTRITIKEYSRIRSYETKKDPLYEIESILKRYKFVRIKGLPRFCGGLVGYMGYDMVRFFEKLPDKNTDDLKLPDSVFLLTDTILIFDHVERVVKIVSNAHIKGNAIRAYDEAIKKIKFIEGKLKVSASARSGCASGAKGGSAAGGKSKKSKVQVKSQKLRFKSNVTRKYFRNMVQKAKDYITKGDIIQVVLSQRFKTKINASPFDIYRALRRINPSPYMFYLNLGNLKLVGSSPEIMVRTENGLVEVRPIAGTRPRGKDEKEDQKLIKELLKDPKERAEHIMLVDLGRNDIGRVADFSSIKVKDLMTIEKYSHVMHIVSDVIGRLKKNKDIFDVIRATFPAGTVAGAPKIRAMEIIDELENIKRGPYAGAVGYFSFSGNEDFCITIRTIIVKDNYAFMQAGAGIVQDSKPEREYQETLNKARALVKAVEKTEAGLE